MPSIRKRIGYLPSIGVQELITQIAIKEKTSQSKVVGKLVEEALIARGLYDIQDSDNLIRTNYFREGKHFNNSSKYNDLDELISDKGIIYNQNKYKRNKESISYDSKESYDEELFEIFKQFLLFQKALQEKNN